MLLLILKARPKAETKSERKSVALATLFSRALLASGNASEKSVALAAFFSRALLASRKSEKKKENVPKMIKPLGKMSKTRLEINAKLKKPHRERIRNEMLQNELIQNNPTG